ncbi:hypothetical protein L1987_80936 [Smallanthus sonchifolius]|uniref:Uncharacterized protein n=1 Tax=Smallanthus sonchifolius TaxID=185202 RepID=A0ACB8YP13_9ASTR|nr:hypothetical protein L1987_80936 [Smallanthus sonchifolius]
MGLPKILGVVAQWLTSKKGHSQHEVTQWVAKDGSSHFDESRTIDKQNWEVDKIVSWGKKKWHIDISKGFEKRDNNEDAENGCVYGDYRS